MNIYKKYFPFYNNKLDVPLIYFDNAATTQRLNQALEEMRDYYGQYNAPIHRAIYGLGERATVEYEYARSLIAQFIHAQHTDEVVFTAGTTDGINKVALGLEHSVQLGDEIVTTVLEHHSNFVPWQQLAARVSADFKVISLNAEGLLDCADLSTIITKKTKIVALAHCSNVIGTSFIAFKKIIERAREVGALIVVDGAQAVGYEPINVVQLNVDFYAFSGHKMGGPTGVGVLYVSRSVQHLFKMPIYGGGAVAEVTQEYILFNNPPRCYEPGTPPIAEVIGLGAAVNYLRCIGMETIQTHVRDLVCYFLDAVVDIRGLFVVGNKEVLYASGHLVSFVVKGMHAHDVAAFLDARGICVRAGHHCAQPLMRALGVQATVRVSFYLYNSRDEVDVLVKALHELCD